MNEYTVVGFRPYDFTDDKGQRIQGYSLFVTGKSDSPDVVGDEALKLSCPTRLGYIPRLGEEIGVTYGRSGRITEIRLLGA